MRQGYGLLLSLFVVTGGGGMAFAGPVAAPIKVQKTVPVMAANCLAVAANKTLAFGKGVTRVQGKAKGADYSATGCKQFVADITVPSDSGSPGYALNFALFGGTTDSSIAKGECKNMTTDVVFYVKKQGQKAFTKLGGGPMKGDWHDAKAGEWVPVNCTFLAMPGYTNSPNSYSPPKTGTDTYRVVVTVKVGDKVTGAEVGAWHPANIH